MKKILTMSATVLLTSGLAIAQDTTAPSTSPNGGSWTGLLVAAGCSSGITDHTRETADGMPRTTPTTLGREQNTTYEEQAKQADRSNAGSSSANDRMARRTDRGASVNQAAPALTDTVTTPPVDDKGTRGSATKNTPSTGVKDASNTADRSKSAADSDRVAQRAGGKLDRTCYIGPSTTAFALKLQDGRIVPFDEAGNGKIAQQLKSGDRLQDKVKIFRATVKGAMQGDTIAVDTIKM